MKILNHFHHISLTNDHRTALEMLSAFLQSDDRFLFFYKQVIGEITPNKIRLKEEKRINLLKLIQFNMDGYFEYKIEWHKFLLKKFKDLDYSITLTSSNRFPYLLKIKNILNTSIDFTDRWGFLTMDFPNRAGKTKFLKQSEMSVLVEYLEGASFFKHITTNYNKQKYPCRVFPESGTYLISFYDDEDVAEAFLNGDMLLPELLEYRKFIIDIVVADIQKCIAD